MKEKINAIDWNTARDDVKRFIPTQSQSKLDLWNKDLFQYQLNQMKKYVYS